MSVHRTVDPNARLPSAWRTWWATMSLAWRTWPVGACARLGVTLVSSGAAPVQGFALKRVVESTLDGRPSIAWLIVLIVAALAPFLSSALVWDYVQTVMMQRLEQAVTQMSMQAALAPAGIEHLESERYADRLEVVRSQPRFVTLLFDWLAGVLGSAIALGAGLVLLVALHPLLVVPVVLAGGLAGIQAVARRRALRMYEQSVPGQRLAARLASIATTPAGAKDIRMLGLPRWLRQRYDDVTDEVTERTTRGERRVLAAAVFSATIQAVLLAAGLALIIRLATSGAIGAGDVAMGLVVLQSALMTASRMATAGGDLARNTFAARNHLWLERYTPAVQVPAVPKPVPARLHDGIVLEQVTFAYPGTERSVLRDVSLHLGAGSTVALVGDNGAGKTTVVKLLCRFYDPSDGRITVDGVDLRDFAPDQWRSASTGAFQDFVSFQFRVSESIGVGDLTAAGHDRILMAARRGGAHQFVETLPLGFDTQLGREFPDGHDLSHGQWQKLAVSRSLMRDQPLLVLLDEPSAALDARAEHELFERFAEQAAAARQLGAITLLVSHRFSTVRMADHIIVIADGRVIEQGSHDQLLASDGYYAELFTLQSARYA